MSCRLGPGVRGLPAKPHILRPNPALTLLGEVGASFNWNLGLQHSFHRRAGPQRIDVPGSCHDASQLRAPKIYLLG
jgi:hypothetical protein